MQTTIRLVTFGCVLALGAARAEAQAPAQTTAVHWFLGVNAGGQQQSRTVETSQAFTLYEEAGSFTARRTIPSGVLVDANGGVDRIWRQLGLGLAVSNFSDISAASGQAVLPHPLFFDRPRTLPVTAERLSHEETTVHLFASWLLNVGERFDARAFVGPSFFSISHDLVTGGVPGAEAPPGFLGSVTPTIARIEERTTGFNVGLDLTYMLTDEVGGGVLLRYASASLDLPANAGSLDVGGFQAAVGLRVRLDR